MHLFDLVFEAQDRSLSRMMPTRKIGRASDLVLLVGQEARSHRGNAMLEFGLQAVPEARLTGLRPGVAHAGCRPACDAVFSVPKVTGCRRDPMALGVAC